VTAAVLVSPSPVVIQAASSSSADSLERLELAYVLVPDSSGQISTFDLRRKSIRQHDRVSLETECTAQHATR